MSARSSQDVRPLALAVIVLVILAVAGGSHALGGYLAAAGRIAVPVAGALVILVVVVIACRVVATRRSLSRRVRLVVLAPDSFAPSLDSVLRCAAQLSRVRRFVGGWFDIRASAVRVLLDTNMDGLARYSLVVPERSLPAVRAALANYDRVQLHPVESEAPAGGETGGRECVVRAELRLARPSSEPLAHLPLDPDPLQSFTQVLARAHGAGQARVEVAVDLLPCTAGARRRLHRRLL